MRGEGTIVDVVAKLFAQHALKTQKDYQKKIKLNMTKYAINVILKLPILYFRVGLSKLECSKIKLNYKLTNKKKKLIN